MRRVIWWLIVSLIVFVTVAGLWNGFRDWYDTKRLGERIIAAAVISYGITGAIVLFAMFRRRAWVLIPLIIWSVAVVFAAIAASFVYSTNEVRYATAAASGICTIALLIFIVLQVRKEASSW